MKALLLLFSTIMVLYSYSQETTQYRNNLKYTIGITGYDKLYTANADKKLNRFGTFVSYDGFMKDRLSFGVLGGFTYSYVLHRNESEPYPGTADSVDRKRSRRRYVIGLNLSAYLVRTPEIEVYIGGGLSRGWYKNKTTYDKNVWDQFTYRTFMYDAFLGVNYYLNENFGLTGRIGYKTSLFQVGLSYRY